MDNTANIPQEIREPLAILTNLVYLTIVEAHDRDKVLTYMLRAHGTLEQLALAAAKLNFNQ